MLWRFTKHGDLILSIFDKTGKVIKKLPSDGIVSANIRENTSKSSTHRYLEKHLLVNNRSPTEKLLFKHLIKNSLHHSRLDLPLPVSPKAKPIDIGFLDTPDGKPMWLTPWERSMHMHVMGPTGAGKSKFLEWCLRQDIRAGNGVLLMDPTGDLYYDLIAWIQRKKYWDKREIVLIDPGMDDRAFGFNPLKLDASKTGSIDFAAQSFITAITRIFDSGDSKGTMGNTPTLRKHLTNLCVVLSKANLTLMEYNLVMSRDTSPEVRDYLLRDVPKMVRESVNELVNQAPRDYVAEVGSTMNRLHPFLVSEVTENIFTQHDKSIDFRGLMDRQAIVLVNLGANEGRCPPLDMNLLGTLLINELFVQSVQRPKTDRVPFYLYVDECHQFLTPDVERLLVECRKYGLHAVLAHQHLGQLRDAGEKIYDGVMANARNKVVFGGLKMSDCREIASDIFAHEIEKGAINPLLKNYATVGHEVVLLHGSSHTEAIAKAKQSAFSDSESSGSTSAKHHGGFFSDIETTFSDATSYLKSSTQSGSETVTKTSSDTRSENETLKAVIKELPGAVLSPEEKLIKAATKLRRLGDRQAIISPVYNDIDAQLLYVPEVKEVVTTTKRTKEIVREQISKDDKNYTPIEEVRLLTHQRKNLLTELVRDSLNTPKQETIAHKVKTPSYITKALNKGNRKS